eukprot:Pgem_evm1s878
MFSIKSLLFSALATLSINNKSLQTNAHTIELCHSDMDSNGDITFFAATYHYLVNTGPQGGITVDGTFHAFTDFISVGDFDDLDIDPSQCDRCATYTSNGERHYQMVTVNVGGEGTYNVQPSKATVYEWPWCLHPPVYLKPAGPPAVATRGNHNCYLGADFCPIYIYGTNLPDDCAVQLPEFLGEDGQPAELIDVDCKSGIIEGKVGNVDHIGIWPVNKIMDKIFPTGHAKITMDIINKKSGNVVTSVDIDFHEPKPSLKSGRSHCFDANESNCPLKVKGYAFTQGQLVTAKIKKEGTYVPTFVGVDVIKSVSYSMSEDNMKNLMTVELIDSAAQYLQGECHSHSVEITATDSQGNTSWEHTVE